MLVTFKSTSYADITMFGDVAVKLLKLMGQSGEVPGAIASDSVTDALATLNKKLTTVAPELPDSDEEDAPVSLTTRAQPLIQLLEASVADGSDVIWEN